MLRRREANLLGTVSLEAFDRMARAAGGEAELAGEGAAGVVALGTFLDGATIGDLSRALGLSHSATVRLVDKLERRGDLRRRPGPDRRSLSIASTARGRERARRVLDARRDALEGLLEPLSAPERAQLAELHAKILTGVVAGGAKPVNVCRLCDADGCGHERGRCPVTEAGRALAADRI